MHFKIIQAKYIIEIDALNPTPPSHNIHRDKSCELDGKVALSSILRLRLYRLKHQLVKLTNPLFVHCLQTLNGIVSNTIDVLLLELGDILHQGADSFTAREQGTD